MSGRQRIGLATGLVVVILVLGVGQLVLPGLAAQVVRDRLSGRADGVRVHVSAFPAIELLVGDADSVSLTMRSYRAGPPRLADDLGQTVGVDDLRVSIDRLDSGLVTLRHVTMVKHGRALSGSGDVTEAALRAAVPFLSSVTPIGSAGGVVTLQGTTTDLPIVGRVTADADLGAQDGRVTLAVGGLLGSVLPSLTVWSNPRVAVTALAGHAIPGGLALSATAELR